MFGKCYKPLILGYHGCDRDTGEKALSGTPLSLSDNAWDWLGAGIYFWENDKARALEWAQMLKRRGKINEPFVVGAILDLDDCLDLTQIESCRLLKVSYDNLKEKFDVLSTPMPSNKSPGRLTEPDKLHRFLDCAVINNLLAMSGNAFDSVRGLFVEGKEAYPGSAFRELSHTQISIINPSRIVGYFRVS